MLTDNDIDNSLAIIRFVYVYISPDIVEERCKIVGIEVGLKNWSRASDFYRCSACLKTGAFQARIDGHLHGRAIPAPEYWNHSTVKGTLPPEERRYAYESSLCPERKIWVGSDCGGLWVRIPAGLN